MKSHLCPAIVLFALFASAAVPAKSPEVVVSGTRVRLGDIIKDAPAALADLDLGPSPPAGSSRLISKREILAGVAAAGDESLVLPHLEAVRVVRASRRWQHAELEEWLKPALSAALPDGVRLVGLTAPRALTTAKGAILGRVEIGRIPARSGLLRTSAVFEILTGSELEQRVSVPIRVRVRPSAVRPDVLRGSALTLVIDTGGARVTAAGEALGEGRLGDIVVCKVLRTRKVLRARLLSGSEAEVLAQ